MQLKSLLLTWICLLVVVAISAQKVGINIDTPNVELDIRTINVNDGAELRVANSDQSHYLGLDSGHDNMPNPMVYWMPSDTLLFGVYDPDTSAMVKELMRILPNGKVGIGITNPDVHLDVDDMIRTSGNKWPSSGEGMEFAYDRIVNRGFIQVYDRDSATWGQLYLGNGNVGIGVVNPLARLHIAGGEANIPGGSSGDLRIGDSAYGLRVGVATAGGGAGDVRMFAVGAGGNNRLILGTGTSDRLTVNNVGNIGIGTTNPAVKLEVTDIIRTSGNTWPTTGEGMELAYDSGVNRGYIQVYDRDSATWGQLYLGNGNVGIGVVDPAYKFEVLGDMRVSDRIGIGIKIPSYKLQVDRVDTDGTVGVVKISDKVGLLTQTMVMDGSGIDALSFYLDLQASTTNGIRMVDGGGSVGIGTNPSSGRKLSVKGSKIFGDNIESSHAGFSIIDTYSGINEMIFDGNNIETLDQTLYLNAYSGKPVGINTTYVSTEYALSVGGKIIAEEMRVQLEGLWPDYVFENDYPLRSLQELEQLVYDEKHLPGIPNAKEVSENGFLLGDMQKRMLQSLEELTLYVIQQNKELHQLKSRIQQLENQ